MEGLNIRMIRKRFKCHKCSIKQSGLVNINQNVTPCEKCGILIYEISEKEYQTKTREDINKNYRLVFEKKENKQYPLFDNGRIQNTGETQLPKIESRQNRFSNSNTNNVSQPRNHSTIPRNNNIIINSNSQNRIPNNNTNPLNSNNILGFILRSSSNDTRENNRNDNIGNVFNILLNQNGGLNESPFRMHIITQEVPSYIFDPTFSIFGSVFNDIFRNNFSSNFRSNFVDEESLFEFLRSTLSNRETRKRPPTARTLLRNLKKLNMNEKYCKKDKNKIEYPSCSVCISDIRKNEETILLPCGHMYHSKCIMEWLKENNTCPVCRFELK
jgi:hypothetical protein